MSVQNNSVGSKSVKILAVLVIAVIAVGLGMFIHHRATHPYLSRQLPGETWEMESEYHGKKEPKSRLIVNVKSPDDATIESGSHMYHNVQFECGKHSLKYGTSKFMYVLNLDKQTKGKDTFSMTGFDFDGHVKKPQAGTKASQALHATKIIMTAE